MCLCELNLIRPFKAITNQIAYDLFVFFICFSLLPCANLSAMHVRLFGCFVMNMYIFKYLCYTNPILVVIHTFFFCCFMLVIQVEYLKKKISSANEIQPFLVRFFVEWSCQYKNTQYCVRLMIYCHLFFAPFERFSVCVHVWYSVPV